MAGGTLLLTPDLANGRIDHPATRKREWPSDVHDLDIPFWDTGVFHTGLRNVDKAPKLSAGDVKTAGENGITEAEAPSAVPHGTQPYAFQSNSYHGSRLALSKIHTMIEQRFASILDSANIEPSMPHPLSLEEKRGLFRFTDPADDSYPPHLDLDANKPAAEMDPNKTERSTRKEPDNFSKMRLVQMATLVPNAFPNSLIGSALKVVARNVAAFRFGSMGRPDEGDKLADVEEYNKRMRERRDGIFDKNDIYNHENIGDLPDWYSDRRFAQQQFTGTNPTTLERASEDWIQHFILAASADEDDQRMKVKIQQLTANDPSSLYIQDYSYFRRAAGIDENDMMHAGGSETHESTPVANPEADMRYEVASVCLFHLQEDGQLQPLAIVLDWRGDAQNSVTVYNKELPLEEQATDWPWRYAKTCAQTSDWLRHEVTVHLVRTHFVEESTIVAAQSSFEDSHPILQLLYPHWQKTLSINAGARSNLVPNIFTGVLGINTDQVKKFITAEYRAFDFKGSYVPADLNRRGFPVTQQKEERYKNYVYARCIYSMWFKIRDYVEDMLSIHYRRDKQDADQAVQADQGVKDWYTTMQKPGSEGGADMPTFPTITTFEELVDCATMCIHIASPQHTAVNYLQNYYQAFVPNKPPCLYRAPPTSLAELKAFTEKDLVEALPMNHPREWLLASHIPYLLSDKPGENESLIGYAASKYHWYLGHSGSDNEKILAAAAKFYKALSASEEEFRGYASKAWDAHNVQYHVLSPTWNAVSIVI